MIFSTLDLDLAGVDQAYSFLQPQVPARSDILLWDPAGLYPALQSSLERATPAVLNPAASEHLLAASRHWRQQLRRHVAAGGTLVVLLSRPHALHVHTLHDIMQYRWDEPLRPWGLHARAPQDDPAAMHSAHTQAAPEQDAPRIDGRMPPLNHVGEPFRTLFEQAQPLFTPVAALDQTPGAPVLADASGATLAAYLSLPPGRILWLPELDRRLLADPAQAARFRQALGYGIGRLGQQAGIQLSDWLDSHAGGTGHEQRRRRAACLEQRRQLDEQLALLERDIAQDDFFRQIVAGTSMGVMPAVAEALRRQGVYVHNDWLTHDLFIAEMPDANLMLKVRLPGEALDAAMWERLAAAQARIEEYFGRPARTLVVDCSQNGLPLADRNHTVPPDAAAQLPGALLVHSAHYFGWHINPQGCRPADLLQRLQAADTALLTALLQSARRELGLDASSV